MTSVVVLGGTGMLGSAVVALLAGEPGIELHASARSEALVAAGRGRVAGARWFRFDAESATGDELPARTDWIVNAIGVIKTYIHHDDQRSVERAIVVNALFPHRLAAWAASRGARVAQIATDCVFSGARGAYGERDLHDALDVYGKTKSLGEVRATNVHDLRCSIVGPEAKEHRSLLDWFLGQARGATVNGFTNHRWNGVTTLHFARIVRGLVRGAAHAPAGLQHVVPADTIAKADLLQAFATSFDRGDVKIVPGAAAESIDRTLTTIAPATNLALWRGAGHDRPPTIRDMVRELAGWDYPFRDLAVAQEGRA